jgi:hypothetical protein
MAITATYVGTTQFTVAGDQTANLPIGRILEAVQAAPSENVLVAVAARIYQDDPAFNTLVTVTPAVLTSDLGTIRLGSTFADLANSRSNTGLHEHTSWLDGGDIPAADLTDADVANLQSMPVPTTGDDRKLVAIVVGSTGFEFITLNGTTNQIVVTNGSGTKTLSLPQNVHTAATPTFAGLTLSALTGVLAGQGASAVVAVNPTDALQILRQDATDTFLEFAGVNLGELADVNDDVSAAAVAGDMYYYDGTGGEITRLPIGTEGTILSSVGGVPTYVEAAESGGGADEATVFFYAEMFGGTIQS